MDSHLSSSCRCAFTLGSSVERDAIEKKGCGQVLSDNPEEVEKERAHGQRVQMGKVRGLPRAA